MHTYIQGYTGKMYDCDFNQQLATNMVLKNATKPRDVSVCTGVCVWVDLYVCAISKSLSLSLSLPPPLSLPLSLCLPHSLPLSHSLCLSSQLSIYIYSYQSTYT